MTIQLAGLNGGTVDIAADALQSFKAAFKGPLLTADDPAYEDTRKVWNAMIDRRPGLIARCTGTADVVQAVRFARQHGLLDSVRGGGHNIAGLAVCEGGLMIDMSLLRGVWVDPARQVARAQAGCTLGDVDRETQLHGLAAVLGFVSATGIAGLTVGGGFGYLTRAPWLDLRQPDVDGSGHCGGANPARLRERERRLVLGPARWRRQLRHRHVVRVPARAGRPRNPRRRDRVARRGRQAGARRVQRIQRQGAARADDGRRAAHRATCAVAAERGARQADRRALRLPQRPGRTRRGAARPLAQAGSTGGRHRDAAALHANAEPARRHAAQGSALLLEVALPGRHRWPHDRVGRGARRPHPLAAFGDPAVPDSGCTQ